jgi:superfamily II DNA or RNA helicase
MTSRPYQIEIDNQLEAGWAEARKQLVISTMGSGKTICFAQLALRFCRVGERVLVLVDQDELVRQAVAKIEATTDLKCEVEKAEYRAGKSAAVVVASVQSMMRRLAHWPANHFGLVIADEADKSLAASWQKCLNHFDAHAKVAGFTATPNRGDLRNLGEYYERIAFEAYFFDFIGRGKWAFDVVNGKRVQKNWVAPITIQMVPIKIDLSGKGAGKDFTNEEADEIITPHLKEIARCIQFYAPFRRTLVFLPLIKTCERFAELANDIGLSTQFTSGVDDEQQAKLKGFRNWDFDVLANSMLLTRGIDIPEIEAAFIGRVTKSVSFYQQMVGRITRLSPGKGDALLLDPLFQACKKMVCRPAHLIAKNDEEAESITKLCEEHAKIPADVLAGLDLTTLAATAGSQREEALRKKLEEQRNKKAALISAEDFAMRHGSMAAAEFEPTMFWQMGNVTSKQEKYLKEAKIDISTVKGTAHASQLLDIYFQNKALRLASPNVLAAINRSGYTRGIAASIGITDFSTVTHEQGRKFFAALNGQRKERIPA